MLDINFIRQNPELVKEGLKRRGVTAAVVGEVIKLLGERGGLQQKLEAERAERNKIAEEMAKSPTDELVQRGKMVKAEIHAFEGNLRDIDAGIDRLVREIPNLPASDIPGGGEENNRVIKTVGFPQEFKFKPKDHLELGETMGIIDVERAAKVSGSRFGYLKSDGALLELALINHAMKKLTSEGFIPVFPPVLIKKEITEGLGYWQRGGNENYYYVQDYDVADRGDNKPLDLYLVGTTEHAIVPTHKDETFNEKELPRRYAAFSSCFRREAGSYGKDTRGIFRVHQFDKVEMVSFVSPENADEEYQELVSIAEGLMQDLELPYQVIELAAGDLGVPSAKTYDIETWIPSQGRYRETHSISTTTDYQARWFNIRYRGKGTKGYVHILNGTAFAIGRTVIAVLENFQQKDGSVTVPKVLRPYMGKEKISPAK